MSRSLLVMRVEVSPELLRWARVRSRIEPDVLVARFPSLDVWERGERQPTLKQLEDFANATHAPIGYFFLPEPPVEQVPIPDLRTVADHRLERPSPDLLDTIHLCQRRQEWYREFARSIGERECGRLATKQRRIRPAGPERPRLRSRCRPGEGLPPSRGAPPR